MKKVIAVTSCATGIAHTYMAARAIKDYCEKNGFQCKVETQGAMGKQNILSDDDIKNADLIIFAYDGSISNRERFNGYEDKIKEFGAHEITVNPELAFNK